MDFFSVFLWKEFLVTALISRCNPFIIEDQAFILTRKNKIENWHIMNTEWTFITVILLNPYWRIIIGGKKIIYSKLFSCPLKEERILHLLHRNFHQLICLLARFQWLTCLHLPACCPQNRQYCPVHRIYRPVYKKLLWKLCCMFESIW